MKSGKYIVLSGALALSISLLANGQEKGDIHTTKNLCFFGVCIFHKGNSDVWKPSHDINHGKVDSRKSPIVKNTKGEGWKSLNPTQNGHGDGWKPPHQ